MGDRAEGGSRKEAGELRFALGGESLGKDFGVTVGPYAVGDRFKGLAPHLHGSGRLRRRGYPSPSNRFLFDHVFVTFVKGNLNSNCPVSTRGID